MLFNLIAFLVQIIISFLYIIFMSTKHTFKRKKINKIKIITIKYQSIEKA